METYNFKFQECVAYSKMTLVDLMEVELPYYIILELPPHIANCRKKKFGTVGMEIYQYASFHCLHMPRGRWQELIRWKIPLYYSLSIDFMKT